MVFLKLTLRFTQFVESKFKQLLLAKLNDFRIDILEFQVPEDSFKCLTMAGRLKGKILDGVNFSNIPLEDWSVLLEYGKRKTEATLKPSIINNNQTMT